MDAVCHLSSGDVDDWEHALANVENLLDDDTIETGDVALLVNGDAIRLFTERSPFTRAVRALGTEVRRLGCRNAVEARGIPTAELLASVELVPSGVGELTRLQHEGYAYMKVP